LKNIEKIRLRSNVEQSSWKVHYQRLSLTSLRNILSTLPMRTLHDNHDLTTGNIVGYKTSLTRVQYLTKSYY